MSRIVTYEPCPACRRVGRDSRGDNLAVYDDGGAHCFACKYHEFPKHYVPKKKVENVPKSLRPFDYTREVPAAALKWLLQYGLPWSYWKESLGYSPKEGRLVFDVGNPLDFSIGRYIEELDQGGALRRGGELPVLGTKGQESSYKSPSSTPNQDKPVRKWFVWGDCHKHTEVVGAERDGPIVLVEDLISAHKVGQVTTAVPLFGTKLYPCHIHTLINKNKPVVLWLDKDQELNVKKQAWQLESVINRPVKVVITDKDPKELSFESIKDIL